MGEATGAHSDGDSSTGSAYDCAVVGGGVAGLMTALRLAMLDWRVVVIEQDLIGAGATLSNHGVVHSGALYAHLHPEIVPSCGEAQAAYRASFPDCIVETELAWYLGTSDRIAAVRRDWDALGVSHSPVAVQDLESIVRAPETLGLGASAVQEVVISTRALLLDLVARCFAFGVDMITSTGAVHLRRHGDVVTSIHTGTSSIRAGQFVLCSGVGTHRLLESCSSVVASRIKSRLDLMVSLSNVGLKRPLFGLEFGWPTVAPARHEIALASRYGAPQPEVDRPGRWAVPVNEAQTLISELAAHFQPGLLDFAAPHAWLCSKTEYSAGASDAWGVEPNFAVVDHHSVEGIDRLWTVLPGKMTLALHASRDITQRLTGRNCGLEIVDHGSVTEATVESLVAASPWHRLVA